MKTNSFKCLNCRQLVRAGKNIGTAYRNHCPRCLWSKHVMGTNCGGLMKPIGLTFKYEGEDKYDKKKVGELMLIHQCQLCSAISINRIAADDEPAMIVNLFEESKNLEAEIVAKIKNEGIRILVESDKPEILTQLYGKRPEIIQ